MKSPNLSYIDNLAADDERFRSEFIAILKTELPLEVELYRRYIEQEEWKSAAESVHKMKHKLGIASMDEAYEIAIRYEEELKTGSKNSQIAFERELKRLSDFVSDL
ncbi:MULTISPECIES: Hpt domain-containing protein [unclassified Leeuwenhoekiella]|uniref:Hpt domain-containing protein n=1 Tax=unclassified Leeuwenhoekiella TaxID=2615029 RepID=UPI000C5B6E8B|nr:MULTISPECIES: Hpt domain-containing protein [unclassified Leeuwenhoekiella]MAW97028.1 histidine kinase [Leeuwenhoekiella sp.]MBA80691.1 histidine kinase [Leeuwenhoekiella sp.]|tara:strand:- start:41980 stop:42297 length:318 start_codon:yes stop_codon:yes gene_type:complete